MAGTIPGSDNGLSMLSIESHATIDCNGSASETLYLQTNPEKLSYSFSIQDGEDRETNADGASAPPPVFTGYEEMDLQFEFYADATGIVPIGKNNSDKITTSPPSIKKYLSHLQTVLYGFEPETHGPPYLKLLWGNVFPNSNNEPGKQASVFKARLKSCNVDIILFSLKGEPVRAKITLQLKSIIAPEAKPLGNSPDITHMIDVKYGDKLSTICNDIYGRYDTKIMRSIAEYNSMVGFFLKPGSQLIFPSIHLLEEEYLSKYESDDKPDTKEAPLSEYKKMAQLIGEQKAAQYFRLNDSIN
jgi:hypothetical protein